MAFVQQLSNQARERLVSVPEETALIEVARQLHAGTDIVVLCASSGALAGILTKTDIVGYVVATGSLAVPASAALRVRSEVVTCHLQDELHSVWKIMHARDLKNIPVVDNGDRPIGVLNARDVLEVLLVDTEIEENLLRDYVMGLGYR